MCVIIIKQKEQMMSREVAKTSARINPHGLGIIWLDTFEVTYHASKDYSVLLTNRPFIAHFRYATIGAINKENTHPFQCGRNKDEWLMMNGTICGLGDAKMCDSKVLAISLGQMPRHTWKNELAQYECRFVSVNTRNRSFQIFNKHLYTFKDGIWYSKANVLQENLIAVYGTLKKGYSNYQSYLKSSKFVGSGVTKDKYPLVISGLPYMVDEKGLGHNVEVDVFKVSNATFNDLDQLEGHPKWYKRRETKIKMSNGKELTCWLYFNPKTITSGTQMHKTYTQSYMPSSSQRVFFDSNHNHVNTIYSQHSIWDEGYDKKDCLYCFQDLQFDDTINQYHCNGCDEWFNQGELNKF